MRKTFDEQLDLLNRSLIETGALCEAAITAATNSLKQENGSAAAEAHALSYKIDAKEREIEHMCMKLLLMQQPVAHDLRAVSAALKMVTDMERIGDNSSDIAEIAGIGNIRDNNEQIMPMADTVIKMVKNSIDAFVKKDVALAESVISSDDEADDLFDKLKNGLIVKFRDTNLNGEEFIDLLMIAKYFERMGDHAARIAQWVVFSVNGDEMPV